MKSSDKVKRISVFAPVGTLDHQTSLLNAITSFAEAGYRVDVYAVRNRRFATPVFHSANVRMRYMPWTFDAEREPRMMVTVMFVAWILAMLWRRHPIIYAGGIRGLFAAYFYSLFRRTHIINYQMELYLGDKLQSRIAKWFKTLERRGAQRSEFSIEHSDERREVLAQDLGIPRERILTIPNAPIGPGNPIQSKFMHNRMGLDESTRILLCPGTLGEEYRTSVVVRESRTLPPGWHCVVHSPGWRDENDPYIQGLRELGKGAPVSFSLNPVPYSQIDDVLGSARIGIALYTQGSGPNWSTIGLASGKLSHFMKVGIPVIVAPLPGLTEFVHKHGIGEVLEQPEQMRELVDKIEGDWDAYRARALRCFEEHLSYNRNFKQVLERTDRWLDPSHGEAG